MISPKWIDSKVLVNLSSEEIRQAPEYSEKELLTRNYESQLHKYYNRHVYCPEDPSAKKQMF